ncbi:hypothetical protein Plhal710r2_c057g0166251 [Plasmopara halstedii]
MTLGLLYPTKNTCNTSWYMKYTICLSQVIPVERNLLQRLHISFGGADCMLD